MISRPTVSKLAVIRRTQSFQYSALYSGPMVTRLYLAKVGTATQGIMQLSGSPSDSWIAICCAFVPREPPTRLPVPPVTAGCRQGLGVCHQICLCPSCLAVNYKGLDCNHAYGSAAHISMISCHFFPVPTKTACVPQPVQHQHFRTSLFSKPGHA
jgi:hypothetical protein